MYYITQENCNTNIVQGYELSLQINQNTERNMDSYHPQNKGVFVYKTSAFAVHIACHYLWWDFCIRIKVNRYFVY